MADLKYQPVTHDHTVFLDKAMKREEFKKAYEDLEEEYALAKETGSPSPSRGGSG